jgi:hypothetical protein
MSSRVVPVKEEGAEAEPVPEEAPTSVEIGFDICGTDPEPEFPADQGKPWLHLTFPCDLKSFTSLMLLLYCIKC